MPVNFNSKPLEMFHGAQFANANSIVNLDGDNKLKSNGKLGSALWKPFRSGDTKDANNAIRTQLLKSLGQAFGLSGMTETGGKVTFSRAFMDELEKILGRMGLSARAYTRILKVARTIADLAAEPAILPAHLLEAAGYRFLDRRRILD